LSDNLAYQHLKEAETEQVPVRRINTWIRNQGIEPTALIEFRENPLLSITRKKFGQ
jgi:hypothetical protein